MENILNLSHDELILRLNEIGQPKFRANQIWNWMFKRGVFDFYAMSNVPKSLRQRLGNIFFVELPKIHTVKKSTDGTIKFALELFDNNLIETVLIPESTHYTQCLSSQVGCALKCSFCSTGKMGFIRNLEPFEILGQILIARKYLSSTKDKLKIRNLVFMGMGEPLLNWENVKKALYVIRHKQGLEFSYRHTTISTVCIPRPLMEFATQDLGSIAISLHAPNQLLREEIMPRAAKIIELQELISLLSNIPMRSRQRITIEYILIGGVNDSIEHARELNRVLSGVKCKINLIKFNPGPDIEYRPPRDEDVLAFEEFLRQKGQITTLRKSRGQDISAACGQLRAEIVSKQNQGD